MDLTRFQNSSSGRLLQFGEGEAAYWAFIPNPLPPSLQLDAELVRTLSEADRAIGELAGLVRTMSNPQLLISPFIRCEAVLSSRIEGTQADLRDLYAYEAGQLAPSSMKPTPAESDVREVHNYVRAMEYGLERIKTLPISLRFIRELHERLMTGVRGDQATLGEFRRLQNWIGPPGCKLNQATYIPPPVNEMHEALDAFEKYLHAGNEYPPLMRLALTHYQLEAIHPFLDGNGRIGRLLISMLLVHWNLLSLPLLYLSAFFERHRQDYYDLLLAVSERGACREWVLYFLRGIREQARSASSKAKQLQDLQFEWRELLQRARMSGLVFGIADFLFQAPILSAREVQERFKVSHPAAVQAMQRLEKRGILQETTGKERNRIYVANAIMKIVE
jgi:Fic family protein